MIGPSPYAIPSRAVSGPVAQSHSAGHALAPLLPFQKRSPVKGNVPFENAVDLLDADHKAVKQMFIDFNALCEDAALAEAHLALAERICQAMTVHNSQIEEEIFYPAVRQATGDEPLRGTCRARPGERTHRRIQGMKATADAFDAKVKKLGKAIDAHVLEEREQISSRRSERRSTSGRWPWMAGRRWC